MKKILVAIALLAGTALQALAQTASISIDSRVQYQHVTGFGGFSPSPQWSYWLNDSDMDKLYGKSSTQLGLNIVRLYISPNKNFWNAGVANAKRAKKYGAFVFASPWSPPAEWKSNKETANGGSLLESHYEDWANRLNEYYDYMKQNGVIIDAISLQNEPDWKAEYESCVWTGEQMAKFLRLYGSKIKCKIIAPEAIHFTKSMHEPILKDAEACEQLDILGGHFYGWNGSSYPLAAEKGKEVWMTEFLINERQQNEGKNITWKEDGFLFARSVNDCMLANMSAWVHYSLKRYYGVYGDGQFGTTNNAITKRGYILSQYAKYVSGTTRVRHVLTDASGKMSSSAYLSSTGDSIVVMLLNPTDNTVSTTIDLPFLTEGGAAVVTTSSKNARKTTLEFDAMTHEAVVDAEPWSVNTYIFTKSAVREDMPDTQEEESLFADKFDYSGGNCIPEGWKAVYEGGTRSAGNYDSGPRIMSFSPEGLMPYAFYFRTGTDGAGSVSYGENSKYRLTLEPGKYTLYYSLVGWKAAPNITATVRVGNTTVGNARKKPEHIISANGSASRITQSTDVEIDFEVTETGNCILKWTVPAATGGLAEALVGNIRLAMHNDNGETEIIPLFQSPDFNAGDAEIYDMQGRRIPQLQQGINIIKQNGVVKKILR